MSAVAEGSSNEQVLRGVQSWPQEATGIEEGLGLGPLQWQTAMTENIDFPQLRKRINFIPG